MSKLGNPPGQIEEVIVTPDPGTDQINLVLLVDTEILKNAPAINDLPDDFSEGWDNDAFDYWSQNVQMTREGEQ